LLNSTNDLDWLDLVKVWFEKWQELVEVKPVEGWAKNYLQIRVQIYDTPIICILKSIGLDVGPERRNNLGSCLFLYTQNSGKLWT